MKAIMVMFDTLSKDYLPNYGNDWIHAPNFDRLREQCVTFDNFYGGSMPCMPARRELHTGKFNFLHRSWGPLEPFDHSVFADLDKKGIYTHLITDHSHYFEDGGATYHNRYSSWEGMRGQEGDRWIPRINALPDENHHPLNKQGVSRQQHMANRTQIQAEEDFSSVQVIENGLQFLQQNHDKDNWFLQLECFDPHEPFYVPEKYRQLYDCVSENEAPYWPVYANTNDIEVGENDIQNMRKEYAALISMCDAQLGRVLDFMDENDMWQDTMLIVNTDHGFLLGEHDWLGKNIAPMYEEIVHIPFFMHLPNQECQGKRVDQLAQTIDIPATLRDYFDLEQVPSDGKSLLPVALENEMIHSEVLFGVNGGCVNICDGRYTYMRASRYPDNGPLVNYTLMPTTMRSFLPKEILATSELVDGGRFTEGMKVLKVQIPNHNATYQQGDLLFDLKNDPPQETPLVSDEVIQRLAQQLKERLLELDVPEEELIRLGYRERI